MEIKSYDDTISNFNIPSNNEDMTQQKSGLSLFEEDELFAKSLTPVNVLKGIRQDIYIVLGLSGNLGRPFTDLEKKMADSLENVVRKGFCPSIFSRDKVLLEVLRCLTTHFQEETVSLELEDKNGVRELEVRPFGTLLRNAQDAASLEDRIREYQQMLPGLSGAQKRVAETECRKLKVKKDQCLLRYQKVVFSYAAELRSSGKSRKLVIGGNQVSLDELAAFYKWR